MRGDGWTDRRAWITVLVGAVPLISGTVITALGGSPAVQLFAVAALLVLCLGQSNGWLLAVGETLVGTSVAAMLLSLLWPVLGVRMEVANTVAAAIVGVACLGLLLRRGSGLRLPSPADAAVAAGAIAPSAVMIAWYAAINATSSLPKVGWIMHNDSAWNVTLTRVFLNDGGFAPGVHPNVAPGTYVVMSSFAAPGRASLGADQLLHHDIGRIAWALLLTTTVVGAVFGVVAASFVPRERWGVRAVVACGAAAVPWTWALFGLAARYGFWNAFVASALLPVVWLAWRSAESAPRRASALLVATGLALMAVWAPLIVVPGILGLGVVARHWRTHLALRGWSLLGWLVVPVALVAWYIGVMAAPAKENASGLGNDGAFFLFPVSSVVISLALLLALVVISTGVRDTSWELLGVGLLLVASVLGIGVLVLQRHGAASGWWGYYPAKFAWLVTLLAAPLAVGAAAAMVEKVRGGAIKRVSFAACSCLLAAGILATIQPADLRVPTSARPTIRATPDWKISTVVPMLSISRPDAMSEYDAAARVLFGETARNQKVVVLALTGDWAYDAWLNFWLLQLRADPYATDDDSEKVRGAAYEGFDDAPGLCELSDAWHGDLTVVTRWKGLQRAINSSCAEQEIEVEFLGALD